MPAAGARLRPLSGLLALVLLAACQDPSGVGLEILGEEGNDPNTVLVVVDSLALTDEPEVTGGFADGVTPAQVRVLVGAVMDPTFGDVSAEGYLDVRPPNTVPSGFFDRTITSATLRLARDYAYGDTTSALDLALFEIDDQWNPTGAKADTSFAAGGRIATYGVSAADTLFSLDLPSSWVTANNEALRSDSVLTEFEGFKLQLEAGAAVVGFDAERSRLRLTTAEDTVDYLIREVFTHIERGDAPPPMDDVVVLRDGESQALAVTLPFDEIEGAAVARAVFRLAADPALLETEMLTRGLPAQLALVGETEGGSRLFLASAQRNEETGTYDFSSSALTSVVQNAVVSTPLFARYLIAPIQSPVSLAVLPVVVGPVPGQGEAERRPRLVLTVVPAAD